MNILDRAKEELEKARTSKDREIPRAVKESVDPEELSPRFYRNGIPVVSGSKPTQFKKTILPPKPVIQPEYQDDNLEIMNSLPNAFYSIIPNWTDKFAKQNRIGYGGINDLVLFTKEPKMHFNHELNEYRALHSSEHIDFFDGVVARFINFIKSYVMNFNEWLQTKTIELANGNTKYMYVFLDMKQVFPILDEDKFQNILNLYFNSVISKVDPKLLSFVILIIKRINKKAKEWTKEHPELKYEIKKWFSKKEESYIEQLTLDLAKQYMQNFPEYQIDKKALDLEESGKNKVKEFIGS